MNKIVNILKNKKQYIQKTKEWYERRNGCFTASNISAILPKNELVCKSYMEKYNIKFKLDETKSCNPFETEHQFMYNKKNNNKMISNIATEWGNKYENTAISIYSNITKRNVHELGLLEHDSIDFLGASPDGITDCGRLIEIKCPLFRKINNIPPFYYWIQCQIQMEVCNIDVCDFFQVKLVEYELLQEWLNSGDKFRGILIEKIDKENSKTYFYPESNMYTSVKDMLLWSINKVKEDSKSQVKMIEQNKYTNTDNDVYNIIYFGVKEEILTVIERDRTWFENILPIIRDKWFKFLNFN